jgi:hypothetical protein
MGRVRRAAVILGAVTPLLAGLTALQAGATLSGGHHGRETNLSSHRVVNRLVPKLPTTRAFASGADLVPPAVNGRGVEGAHGVKTRIDSLTMRDQRLANNGNSFSLEPPDQGLCVGNGYVLEAVNNVFAVYTTGGQQLTTPKSFDPFWNHGKAEIIRHADGTATYGPFVSDPKCYYDPALNRFFMTELQLSTNPKTGDFTGGSFVNIAVSKSSKPGTAASAWHRYRLNVQNTGRNGTPSHTGCPCLGDQPLIGADRYGFYISTNEFPIFKSGFNGAQLYAFDKAALARGTMKVQRIEQQSTPLAESIAASVQPATSPTPSQWSNQADGTEFLMSALDFTGGLDNRIAVWSLTNTSSLAGRSPHVVLHNTVLSSQTYGFPPAAEQKAGPIPLGDSVNEPENKIESNDDRMNQVVYADGKLWGGLNTVVQTPDSPQTVGIAYFVVRPTSTASAVTAAIKHQDYVSVRGNSVIFPSIGVSPERGAVMTFTLTGVNYHPSAAAIRLGRYGSLAGPVQLLAAGTKPADGFSGYKAFDGNGVERWGDYSAAVADATGNVWVATEYIPGTFGYPPFIANWGTYIASMTP